MKNNNKTLETPKMDDDDDDDDGDDDDDHSEVKKRRCNKRTKDKSTNLKRLNRVIAK